MRVARAWAIFSALLSVVAGSPLRRLHQDAPPAGTPAAPASPNVRVCLPVEAQFAAPCDAALKELDDPVAGLYFQCVPGTTVSGCLSMVNSGIVEMAKVPGRGVYEAWQKYDAIPIVAESFSDSPDMKYKEGYAVAAVTPAWCASVDNGSQNPSLSTLAKTNACFSGYQRDGGWQIPVGRLYIDAGMAVESNNSNYKDDAESVAKYFDNVCAPGFYPFFPREDNGKWSQLCSACGDASSCDAADPNYGPKGAVQCLQASADNSVAFTEYPPIDDSVGAGSLDETPLLSPPPPPAPAPIPSPPPPVEAAAVPPPAPTDAVPPPAPEGDAPPAPDGAVDPAAVPPPAPADATALQPPPPPEEKKKDDKDKGDKEKTPPADKKDKEKPPAPPKGDNDKTNAPADAPPADAPPARRLLASRALLEKKSPPPPVGDYAPPPYDPAAYADGGADPTADPTATGTEPPADPTSTAAADTIRVPPTLPVVDPTAAPDAATGDAPIGVPPTVPVVPTPPTESTPTTPPAPVPNADALFVLMCPGADKPEDNCRPKEEYLTCNLGSIPAQAFVAKNDWAESATGVAAKQALLLAGTSNPTFMNAAAKAGVPPFWLITPGTRRLDSVDVSAEEYLGKDYIKTMEAVDKVMAGQTNPNAAAASSSDDGGGLSTTEIIIITVVCIVVAGGLATIGAIYYFKKQKNTGWKRYQDAVRDINRI